jgi:hypothetical protein
MARRVCRIAAASLFSVGEAPRVDSLVVRWPSGAIETHGSVAANTALHLVEGGALTAVVERSVGASVPLQMVLSDAYPNRF